MTFSKSLIGLFLSGGLSYASSLAVYQDKTFYSYTPSQTFIGFSKGVTAKCEGLTMALKPMLDCPAESRLCIKLNELNEIQEKRNTITYNFSMLEKLLNAMIPEKVNAEEWINGARLIAQEQSEVTSKQKRLKKKLEVAKSDFNNQAPVQNAIGTTELCNNSLELKMPSNYISFSTSYEANIEEKEVTVTQNLSILNRSGVDIQADNAMFYYRSANPYVRPIHFSPWIVSKYVPRPQKKYQSAQRSMMVEESLMMSDSVMGMASPAPIATYEDAREYKINNLTLPSTGVPLEVQVLSWKTALECEVRAYPYMNTKAFHVCAFTPKYQIDANSWKVKSGTEVINEKAVGEYRDGTYNLYTKLEEDIKILRKPIVQKERETGIFGGTARKKDGFTLTLTNKSNKEKRLILTERIPTSSTDEIKAKLLSINSEKKVNYKILKNGEIEMKISLAANESKKIEILFEISYDKDIKVNY